MSAELVLAVVGLIDGSIKLARKIKATCETYRNADREINDKCVLVESFWIKIEIQLRFLGSISDHLTDDLIQSHLDLLQRLKGKLTQASSRLEDISPESSGSRGRVTDVLRKWNFTFVKSSLDDLIAELEAWLQRFDPTWYLMILISGKVLDTAVSESAESKGKQEANPLAKLLSIRSALRPDAAQRENFHVTLSHNGLKGAREEAISFTVARTVLRAGSSDLLIVERISCPPGTASQIKVDVKSLAMKLQNVDPDSFGLLRCKGILKHHDSSNRLTAIDVVYRTPLDCRAPQTLRHHLLDQYPVSLSTVIRMAKQLVRSVHYVHTCGFVHKNIRPENLLVFPKADGSALGESFLIGFTEFRNVNFQTNLHGDAAWHRNLYRHSQRQGAFVHERYTMQHDIYSLGICLLEIGLWRSFVWYPAHDSNTSPVPGMALGFSCSDKDFETPQFASQQKLQEHLVALAMKELPPRVGEIYTNIVVTCITCLDPNNEVFNTKEGLMDEDGVVIGVKFVEHVLSGRPTHYHALCRRRNSYLKKTTSRIPRIRRDTMESGNSAYRVRREQNAQDPRAQVDCRFYQHGACRNGHACPYRHQESVDQDVNITIVPPAHDKQPTKLVRAYSGVLAYFQAGVSIYRIRFISDLSIVELTGLPLDWTRDNVDGFLIAQNIGIRHVQEIHVFRGRSHSSARVEFGDPNAAESVVAAFNQLNARQETGVNAIKVPVEAFLSSNSSTLPIDCNTVHCSWPQSSKKVWLIFKKAKVAQRVAQRFRDGQYRILNQVVGSAVQTPGRPSEVCCTEVSLDATPEDVSRAIWRTEDKPHSIEQGLPRYMETADECAAEVRAQLETISPLRSFELTTQDAQSKYMGAIAKFENGEHAAKVAGTLHDTPLPFLETANLSVQQVYCARYKVSNRLYRAVERQIGAHVQRWAAQSLNFTDHEQAQSSECHRILKIEGRDRKDIVAANKVISDILEGVIAKDGSSNLWHPSMRVDGELARKLEKLEQETGVVIIRNKAKSQIKLFGTPAACDAVNEKISRILNAQRWKDFC
ncbi:hypothetical protein NUW58_g6501 [Xylaria curta]|uniref:Uncharacterized protein n=1 Tax=Xylaria curta TaxID=42375 RepID=A0ACC1NUJ2_9PEZI|nr:hypothetical protein NUW58_g6501 [Xylaria curta]